MVPLRRPGHTGAMSASVLETFSAVSEDLVVPPVPEGIADTGVPGSLIEQLIIKILYFRGELLGRDLGQALGLKFSVIEEIIETLKRQHMITAKRSLGIGNMSAMFTLAEPGRNAARDCLEMNQYSGPTPVPLR